MSASLFYDCYAPYESYPATHHVDGDVSFGELKKGDKLYRLIRNRGKYEMTELTIVNRWHVALGHYYIGCKPDKGRTLNINFGATNISNVIQESKNDSIIYYDSSWFGTNLKSLIKHIFNLNAEEIEHLKQQLRYYEMKQDNLLEICEI